jgi:glutamyl-tRNA synthetase
MSVVTRFAPSPTGYLHIGGARTALYSWLMARSQGGKFVLRIEDTDQERSSDASVQAILDGMEWLGLDYDEGPFYQMQRMDRYKTVIQQLLDEGKAYRCWCSREELDELREGQRARGEKPRYDGRFRDFTGSPPEGVEPVIRFRNPLEGDVKFTDMVRGEIVVSNSELDDLVIARAGGVPTYNLTVVVDDIDMRMTHVLRGDDHINNTPRQINIYEALGATAPVFAHVPMILGDDGARLSKRHGAVSVMQYRDEGYLRQAVLNYLVRLGWSCGDQELFSIEEMISLFKATDCNRAPSAFNTDKLVWLNQHYIKELPADELVAQLQWHLDQAGIDVSAGPDIEKVVDALRERAKTLIDLVNGLRFFYQDFEDYDAKAAKKNLKEAAIAPLKKVAEKLSAVSDWKAAELHACVDAAAEELEVGMGKVGMPLRVAVAGSGSSPPIDITLELLGREKTLARIAKAISWIEQNICNQ